jgi:Probable Zinc-ribbon domain
VAGVSRAERERRAALLAKGLKWCPGCDREISLDFFTNDASRSDGKASKCKPCLYAQQDQQRENAHVSAAKREYRNSLTIQGLKQCSGRYGCDRILPLEDFPPAPRNSDGRATNCRQCHAGNVLERRRESGVKAAESFDERRSRAIDDLIAAGFTIPVDFHYVDVNKPVTVICRCGNPRARILVSDVRKRGSVGCSECHIDNVNASKHASTIAKVQEVIENQPPGEQDVLLGSWLGPRGGKEGDLGYRTTWLRLRCGRPSCSYEWDMRSGNFLQGSRCPACGGVIVVPGINDLGTKRPDLARELKDPSLAETVTVSSAKVFWWRCPNDACGEKYEARVSDRTYVHRGTGCPHCAENGYRLNRSGALYVVFGVGRATGLAIIKFGIANTERNARTAPLKRRLREHAEQGLTEVLSLHRHRDGRVPWMAERLLKRLARVAGAPPGVSRDDLPDGFTEAFVDSATARDWLALNIPACLAEAKIAASELD